MIRINLLKAPAKKKKTAKSARSGKPALAVVVVILLIAAFAGAAIISVTMLLARHRASHQQPVVVVPIPTQFKPSTHVNPNMVEDVVKEVAEEHSRTIASGFLDIAYSDMSTAEKINYEVLHLKYVTEMLTHAVPGGLGLKHLDVDDFQTVYAVGLGSTRDQVSGMFASLKKERLDVLEPPYSYIKANDDQGYRFVVTCKTRFGLDLVDPFQAIDYLPSRDDVPMLAKKMAQCAIENGIAMTGAPTQVSAEKIGPYRRISYRMSGSCSYKDFVRFVMQLYKDKLPCAFKKLSLTARNGNSVDLSAECIFTARD